MAFACFEYVSETYFKGFRSLADGLVAFACFQLVSEPVLWLQVLF